MSGRFSRLRRISSASDHIMLTASGARGSPLPLRTGFPAAPTPRTPEPVTRLAPAHPPPEASTDRRGLPRRSGQALSPARTARQAGRADIFTGAGRPCLPINTAAGRNRPLSAKKQLRHTSPIRPPNSGHAHGPSRQYPAQFTPVLPLSGPRITLKRPVL
jgi:hypothetical protein